MKQCLFITGVSEEYYKYFWETPVMVWCCFWMFPENFSKILTSVPFLSVLQRGFLILSTHLSSEDPF